MKLLLCLASIFVLFGCGGGGGGGSGSAPTGPVASTFSFPLRQALNTLTANGESATLTAIGSTATEATDGRCSGSFTYTASPATTATSFRGQTALSANAALTMLRTNCTPSSIAESGTDYYDTNYVPLGDVDSFTGKMSLWKTAPNIPATVRVNDVIIVGTKNDFTNTSGTISDGGSENTIVVEADTSSTAIINKITKHYNAAGQLTSTSQWRSRIDAVGTLTRVSGDIQYATTSTLHLVFRR